MDYSLYIDSLGQLNMSYDCTAGLANNILLSLIVKKGSFFLDPEFGSRLHEISTTSDSDVLLSVKYAEEATSWMVKIKKVTSIQVFAISEQNQIKLRLVVMEASGKTSEYIYFHRVI